MKKSELKELIKEVMNEMTGPNYFKKSKAIGEGENLKWSDGTEIKTNWGGDPVDGWTYLGYANGWKKEGWDKYNKHKGEQWYRTTRGHTETWYCPSAKIWYQVDSS